MLRPHRPMLVDQEIHQAHLHLKETMAALGMPRTQEVMLAVVVAEPELRERQQQVLILLEQVAQGLHQRLQALLPYTPVVAEAEEEHQTRLEALVVAAQGAHIWGLH